VAFMDKNECNLSDWLFSYNGYGLNFFSFKFRN
jgi:hypothetical protein